MVERGQPLESNVNFAPFLTALKTHGLKLILITAVVTGLSLPVIWSMTAKYVSTATVLIKAQVDNASPIEPIENYDSARSQYYETQFNLMQSRVVLVKAVEALELQQNEQFNGSTLANNGDWILPREQRISHAVKELQRHLTFTSVRLTQLVYVSYESADAQQASMLANGVAQAFIDYTVEQKIAKTQQAKLWNQQQLNVLKQQIRQQKQEIDAFLQSEGLLTFRGVDGFETEELGIITNKLADAKERRLAAQANYELVNKYMKGNTADLTSLPDFSSHPQLQDLRIALIQAKRKLSDLNRRYGPKYIKVLEANAEIEVIQKQTVQLLDELKLGLQQKYQADLIKENHYKALLALHKKDFFALADKREQYDGLMADLNQKQSLYEQLYLRTTEHELNTTYREQDAQIYDPAVISERPAKPNKPLLVVMISIMTMIIGALIVIIRAATKQTITTLAELKAKLGLVPLTDMPTFTSEPMSAWALSKQIRANQYAKEIGNGAYTALSLAHPNSQCIGVVSSYRQEGVTTTALLLASAVSEVKPTLLLDLDYRREREFARDLIADSHNAPVKFNDKEPVAGFSQLVLSHSNSMQRDAKNRSSSLDIDQIVMPISPGLSYLAPGDLDESPLTFFARLECESVLLSLCQRFETVVIKLPALNDSKDAQLLLRFLDSLVVVVKSEQHTANDIRQQLNKLSPLLNKPAFGVLNQVSDDLVVGEESLRFIAQGSVDILKHEAS
ncbi:exopolysaccharide transport family protein [Vibrio sp. ZSDZ65]|uniref:Exopolysaccharide transport family protein n=1 Tax=Vibrio qingdaonensis TaxID=2829491 RepID=A0A9X3HWX2_9VIBR|nr:exopolysaccharide transport family protein [Vibrio qingdaonensis]MCW8347120.1 exopolysaccharide transport family protein [Vibrio qingdaonensis]